MTTEFSDPWGSSKTAPCKRHLEQLVALANVRALEIGSTNGRSALWFAQQILTGENATLDCVGSRRWEELVMTGEFRGRIRGHHSDRFSWLLDRNRDSNRAAYDFIYLGGNRDAASVMQDLVLVWPLLKNGGVLICDLECDEAADVKHLPKAAIAGFFACRDDWRELHHGEPLIIQKSADEKPIDSASSKDDWIEAVVVCVDYADYLKETLPLLVQRVDDVVVVTSTDDTDTAEVVRYVKGAELLVTDCFFSGGATLNKGAAINEGLKRLSRRGWVLQIDADIAVNQRIPLPSDRQSIWGARRFRVDGVHLWQRVKQREPVSLDEIRRVRLRQGFCPSGYFQLWHWPTFPRLYPEAYADASESDIEFAKQWPAANRKLLEQFRVYHLETADNCRGANWGGRQTATFADHPIRRGVLTGANQKYWPTLKLLVQSCHDAELEVAVADHGLTQQQRAELQSRGVILLDVAFPYRSKLPDRGTQLREPPSAKEAWLKPTICMASPFDETIWIDADAVPIRGLDTMFEHLQSGPWVTLETWTTEVQARQTYLRTVSSLVGEIPRDKYPHASRINTGVFAFRRGDAWLKAWANVCERILSDPWILANCRLRDQAALVALLCDAELVEQMPRVLEDRKYNWPANGLRTNQRDGRKKYPWDSADCMQRLREDHPDVCVVHWMGTPKPWAIQ